MRMQVIAAFVALLLTNGVVHSQPAVKLTGTFSDMRFSKEGGDVVGHELRIVFTRAGYQGTYQVAEGSPSDLMLVSVTFKGNTITFSSPSGDYVGSFIGVIDSGGITGTFKYSSGAEEKLKLDRRKGYWD